MLCLFARGFPRYVADFLQLSQGLNRRFREESVTDLMMAALHTAGAGQVRVSFPDETATGADMEWLFVDESDRTYVRLLIQAKKLYGMKGWRTRSYRHLFYHPPNALNPQAISLSDAAATDSHTYPLYAFYNAGSAVAGAAAEYRRRIVEGVNLVDGHFVASVVGNTPKTKQKTYRSLRFWAPFLDNLPSLFCPESVRPMPPQMRGPEGPPIYFAVGEDRQAGTPTPPSPAAICQRLWQMRERFYSRLDASDPPPVEGPLPEPGHLSEDEIGDLLAGNTPERFSGIQARHRALFYRRNFRFERPLILERRRR